MWPCRNSGDLLRQVDQRRGLGHHHQGGQLHRLRPGRGAGTRTNCQRGALICERWRDSAARLYQHHMSDGWPPVGKLIDEAIRGFSLREDALMKIPGMQLIKKAESKGNEAEVPRRGEPRARRLLQANVQRDERRPRHGLRRQPHLQGPVRGLPVFHFLCFPFLVSSTPPASSRPWSISSRAWRRSRPRCLSRVSSSALRRARPRAPLRSGRSSRSCSPSGGSLGRSARSWRR